MCVRTTEQRCTRLAPRQHVIIAVLQRRKFLACCQDPITSDNRTVSLCTFLQSKDYCELNYSYKTTCNHRISANNSSGPSYSHRSRHKQETFLASTQSPSTNPMNCVSFEKINVLRLFKTFHLIYHTRMFINQAQKPLTGLYPQSDDPAQLPQTYLCVLCGSQNKQRLFPYTTLTEWFV